jgi:hypothetical protein
LSQVHKQLALQAEQQQHRPMLLQAGIRSSQHRQQQARLAPVLQQKHTMLMALPAYRWSLQEMRWAAVAVS